MLAAKIEESVGGLSDGEMSLSGKAKALFPEAIISHPVGNNQYYNAYFHYDKNLVAMLFKYISGNKWFFGNTRDHVDFVRKVLDECAIPGSVLVKEPQKLCDKLLAYCHEQREKGSPVNPKGDFAKCVLTMVSFVVHPEDGCADKSGHGAKIFGR